MSHVSPASRENARPTGHGRATPCEEARRPTAGRALAGIGGYVFRRCRRALGARNAARAARCVARRQYFSSSTSTSSFRRRPSSRLTDADAVSNFYARHRGGSCRRQGRDHRELDALPQLFRPRPAYPPILVQMGDLLDRDIHCAPGGALHGSSVIDGIRPSYFAADPILDFRGSASAPSPFGYSCCS